MDAEYRCTVGSVVGERKQPDQPVLLDINSANTKLLHVVVQAVDGTSLCLRRIRAQGLVTTEMLEIIAKYGGHELQCIRDQSRSLNERGDIKPSFIADCVAQLHGLKELNVFTTKPWRPHELRRLLNSCPQLHDVNLFVDYHEMDEIIDILLQHPFKSIHLQYPNLRSDSHFREEDEYNDELQRRYKAKCSERDQTAAGFSSRMSLQPIETLSEMLSIDGEELFP